MIRGHSRFVAFAGLFMLTHTVSAEPYLAVHTGNKCALCHTNPSGGGKRTPYGNLYAQTQLSARYFNPSNETPKYFDGVINEYVAVGGDLRTGIFGSAVDNQSDDLEFDLDEALVYLDLTLIPNRFSLYVDQKVAPGGGTNREAYARFNFANGRGHVKAGQFFLPYGWRLEDDGAFIRQVPGINYNTPDEGVEVGWESGPWSAQFALTNGTAGGPEQDTTKQASLLGSYVTTRWRVGGSFNFNDADDGNRRMQNIFGGIRTGPVSWLGEIDYIVDDGTPTGRRKLWAGFIEANVRVRRGHNIKLTYEHFDPDDDVSEDEQNRGGVLWEHFPFQFTQIRAGVRFYDGIPQNDLQNRTDYFLELHGYF